MYDDDDRWFGLKIALVVLAILGLGLFGAYRWFDTNLNPKPYADDSLRTFLGAVQREDWATAASRVTLSDPAAVQRELQREWSACIARHGALTSFAVRSVFLDSSQAHATLTFADGTTAEWEVSMNPKDSPGWELTYGVPPVYRI